MSIDPVEIVVGVLLFVVAGVAGCAGTIFVIKSLMFICDLIKDRLKRRRETKLNESRNRRLPSDIPLLPLTTECTCDVPITTSKTLPGHALSDMDRHNRLSNGLWSHDTAESSWIARGQWRFLISEPSGLRWAYLLLKRDRLVAWVRCTPKCQRKRVARRLLKKNVLQNQDITEGACIDEMNCPECRRIISLSLVFATY